MFTASNFKSAKGKAPEQHDESDPSQLSLKQLLDPDYIYLSPGKELVLALKSAITPDTSLLLRIASGEITKINDPDLNVFDDEIEKQKKQISMFSSQETRMKNEHIINEAYTYFGLLLNKSLSQKNLFNFISLCIKKEFYDHPQHTAFANTAFIRKYLQTQLETTQNPMQLSENAQNFVYVIFNELKNEPKKEDKNRSKQPDQNLENSFTSFIQFNFVKAAMPAFDKIYKAIVEMQDPIFVSDNPEVENKKSCLLKDLYNKPFIPLGLSIFQKMEKDRLYLLDYLSSSDSTNQDKAKIMTEIVEPLLNNEERKLLLHQGLLSDQFITILKAAYKQIKIKNRGWFQKNLPFLEETTTKEAQALFDRLEKCEATKRLSCLQDYMQNPDNAHRDLYKLLEEIQKTLGIQQSFDPAPEKTYSP